MPTDLPTPPMEPHTRITQKKTFKSPKPLNRASKRTSTSSDHGPVGILDGRHKRVWKACERCRMKKTKASDYWMEVSKSILILSHSVMVKIHASVVKTTAWFAQQVAGKRQNSSNCLEGMWLVHFLFLYSKSRSIVWRNAWLNSKSFTKMLYKLPH